MPTSPSDYRLPCTAVAVRLALAAAEPLQGVIYLAQSAAEHGGAETPLEMLNGPNAFFPFRTDGGGPGGHVLLVPKARAVELVVEHHTSGVDADRLAAARTVDVQVVLATGEAIDGWASVELPEHHSRLLDYLNATAQPFFTVVTDEATHFINRDHVLYARPGD